MHTVKIWGYNLIKESLDIVPLDSKVLVNTISPNSYGIATKDKRMDKALKGSDFLVLDGMYFGLAPLFFKGKKIRRIAGWDCFRYFSDKMNQMHGKVFFLGSSEETLEKIKTNYNIDYPNVKTGSYSPPFKPDFSSEDNKKMHTIINEFQPDVLFVGLTAPKQEKWGFENKDYIHVHVISTIGNVFDWYAGNSTRPSKFWQIIGMEWLVRIFYRPQIFLRNIGNQMIFFWHLFLVLIKVKKND